MTCPCCGQPYDFENPVVSLDLNSVSYRRRTVKLTPTETEVLCVLATHMPNTVERDLMFARVWGAFSYSDERKLLDVYVNRLRRAIAPLGLQIETIKEVGWRLKNAAPVGEPAASETARPNLGQDMDVRARLLRGERHADLARLD